MAIDTERGRAGLLDRRTGGGVVARLTTETKHAFKTTEFWAMVAVIAGILIASAVVDDAEGAGAAGDAFSAQRAWLYVAIVAVGYMVSRGLAKAGSREPYWAGPDDLPGRDPDEGGGRRSGTKTTGRAGGPGPAPAPAPPPPRPPPGTPPAAGPEKRGERGPTRRIRRAAAPPEAECPQRPEKEPETACG